MHHPAPADPQPAPNEGFRASAGGPTASRRDDTTSGCGQALGEIAAHFPGLTALTSNRGRRGAGRIDGATSTGGGPGQADEPGFRGSEGACSIFVRRFFSWIFFPKEKKTGAKGDVRLRDSVPAVHPLAGGRKGGRGHGGFYATPPASRAGTRSAATRAQNFGFA